MLSTADTCRALRGSICKWAVFGSPCFELYTMLDRYVKNTVGWGCAKDLFNRRCRKKDWGIASDSSGVDRQKKNSNTKSAKNRPGEYPPVDERGHPARP